MASKFIYVISGVDGSGKTSLLEATKEYITTTYPTIPFYSNKAPSGTVAGHFIRSKLLFGPRNPPLADLFLLLADMAFLTKEIGDMVTEDHIVLLDRFWGDTIAYQVFGNNTTTLEELQPYLAKFPQPLRNYWLDVSLETQQKRLQERGKLDFFDNEKEEFWGKVKRGYEYLLKEGNKKKVSDWVYVNGEFPLDKLAQMLGEDIVYCFKKLGGKGDAKLKI